MSDANLTDSVRNRALTLLDGFQRRLLPGVLRRIGAWKAIPARQLADLRDDVVQELCVDSLLHARELVAMPARERHARWMQIAERALYRLRRHERRCQPLVDEPATVAEPTTTSGVQLPPLIALHNGRANVAESARQAGLGRRTLRRQLDELAGRLGWTEERRSFWQARAAEALIGLAADMMRDERQVVELDPPLRPDLQGRVQRLHRLAQRFPVQPSTLAVRRALQPWLRRRHRQLPSPRELLRQATALAPLRAAGWLWLFECCTAPDEHGDAARALRRASRCPDVERAALVLARARLLELRGFRRRAARSLRRARDRRDPDGRLLRALRVATS